MSYDKETQMRIDRAMDNKSKSIAWHNASNVAAELLKSYPFKITANSKKNQKAFQETFTGLRDFIYAEWMSWAMSNIVPNPQKLTSQDFVQAKAEAPTSQIAQEQSEELGAEEKINQELEASTQTLPESEIQI